MMRDRSWTNSRRIGLALSALLLMLLNVSTIFPMAALADECGREGCLPGPGACQAEYCPSDYCRKPLPCAYPSEVYCPPTYCPKPSLALPCPETVYCADNYCRKPLPQSCRPFGNAWYKCVPSGLFGGFRPSTCAPEKR